MVRAEGLSTKDIQRRWKFAGERFRFNLISPGKAPAPYREGLPLFSSSYYEVYAAQPFAPAAQGLCDATHGKFLTNLYKYFHTC
jgi:hypothetical protein